MTEVCYFQCYMAITVAFRDGSWCMSVFLPFERWIRCFRIILHHRFTIMLLFEHELPLIAINLVAVMLFLEHEFILSTMSGNCQPLQYDEWRPHQEKVRSRPNGSNVAQSNDACRLARNLLFFCEGLRHLSSAFRFCRIFVPNIKIENWKLLPHPVNSQHSTFNSLLSTLNFLGLVSRRSLSNRFSICFPHFSLSETEKKGKTIE